MSTDASLIYDTNTESLDILCDLINPTDNNYEGSFKIEVMTDNSSFIFEPEVCVYGYTNVRYRFSIPKSELDQTATKVERVNIWYRYGEQEIALGTSRPDGIPNPTIGEESGDITIYTLSGNTIASIRHCDIQDVYDNILSSLPKGIYIIKEGNKTRKLIR